MFEVHLKLLGTYLLGYIVLDLTLENFEHAVQFLAEEQAPAVVWEDVKVKVHVSMNGAFVNNLNDLEVILSFLDRGRNLLCKHGAHSPC